MGGATLRRVGGIAEGAGWGDGEEPLHVLVDGLGEGLVLLHRRRVQYPHTWGATVRGTYPTPEAGTRTQYVLYVGPWGQAALRLRYVHNAGGWYA